VSLFLKDFFGDDYYILLVLFRI